VSEQRLVTDAEANAWALYHARWNDGAEYVEVPPADYEALLDTREALIEALDGLQGTASSEYVASDEWFDRARELLSLLRGDS
jgi:phosphoserine phosphatase